MITNETEFYKDLKQKQRTFNYVFNFEGIINDEVGEDLWTCYRVGETNDCYDSLYELLFDVTFDTKQANKMYNI